MIGIALNIVCIVVLGGVLLYAFRLEKRLAELDKNRFAMEKFLGDFTSAIARAERAIHELTSTAKEKGSEVEQAAARATALRDELHFLIDAADKIATRLTDQTSSAQTKARDARPPLAPMPEEKPVAPKLPEVKPLAEKEKAPEKNIPVWTKPAPVGAKTVPPAPLPVKPAEDTRQPKLSDAERDLQSALAKMDKSA